MRFIDLVSFSTRLDKQSIKIRAAERAKMCESQKKTSIIGYFAKQRRRDKQKQTNMKKKQIVRSQPVTFLLFSRLSLTLQKNTQVR